MVNLQDEDTNLIQIKTLEKAQHIESAQWCINGRTVILTDRP